MEDEQLKERYPSAYRRIRAWMESHPTTPVLPSELVVASGIITREEVIRRILTGAAWAREADGRYVYVETKPALRAAGGKRGKPAASDAEEDRLVTALHKVLRRETGHRRIGVSVTYLRRLCGNPDEETVDRILTDAPWAMEQYGLYRYDAENDPTPPDYEQLTMAVGEDADSGKTDSAPIIIESIDVEAVSPAADDPSDTAGQGDTPGLSEEITPMESAAVPDAPAVPAETADAPMKESWEQIAMPVPEDNTEEMRVGTVLKVKRRARYISATVDFGSIFGKSTVKIPLTASGENLVGAQIVCGVKLMDGQRQIRVRGIGQGEDFVTIAPADTVRNGERVE